MKSPRLNALGGASIIIRSYHMSGPPADVVRAAQAAPATAESNPVTLAELHKSIAEFFRLKDLKRRLEEKLTETNKLIWDKERKELVDALDSARVPKFTVEMPDGTRVEAKAEPYYKANISAEWEPEKRAEGFAYLDDLGEGDMIKTDLILTFNREDRPLAVLFAAMLREADLMDVLRMLFSDAGIEPDALPPAVAGRNEPLSAAVTTKEQVPWNTLTKWLKEEVEKGRTPDLDKIGGEVGRIVKLKEL